MRCLQPQTGSAPVELFRIFLLFFMHSDFPLFLLFLFFAVFCGVLFRCFFAVFYCVFSMFFCFWFPCLQRLQQRRVLTLVPVRPRALARACKNHEQNMWQRFFFMAIIQQPPCIQMQCMLSSSSQLPYAVALLPGIPNTSRPHKAKTLPGIPCGVDSSSKSRMAKEWHTV